MAVSAFRVARFREKTLIHQAPQSFGSTLTPTWERRYPSRAWAALEKEAWTAPLSGLLPSPCESSEGTRGYNFAVTARASGLV